MGGLPEGKPSVEFLCEPPSVTPAAKNLLDSWGSTWWTLLIGTA